MPTVEFEGNTYNVDEDGFIDDFTNWNDHDSYKKAFDRLLDDLKEEK